jgi:small-conductance mechanosensitive channel
MENLVPFIQSALVAVAIAFGAYLAAFVAGLVLRRALNHLLGSTWSNFVANLVSLGILLWGAKIILDYTGAAGALVILATAITGAFAIGSERLAADLVGGVTIFFAKPFEIGQYVSIGDYEGDIVNITLTTTHMNSFDGSRIVLHNSTVMDNTITNLTVNPAIRITLPIAVPGSEDLEKAATVLHNCLASFEPQVRLPDYEGSVVCENVNLGYVEFQVRVFIPSTELMGPARYKLFLHVINALKAAGIQLMKS